MRISDWSSDVCSSDLMDKPKIGCMERLPPETEPIQQFAWPGATARIERVAEQRMAAGRHMDADLMGVAGLQPTFDHRSEERRDGKECVSTCRYRWAPYHQKKKDKHIHNNTERI